MLMVFWSGTNLFWIMSKIMWRDTSDIRFLAYKIPNMWIEFCTAGTDIQAEDCLMHLVSIHVILHSLSMIKILWVICGRFYPLQVFNSTLWIFIICVMISRFVCFQTRRSSGRFQLHRQLVIVYRFRLKDFSSNRIHEPMSSFHIIVSSILWMTRFRISGRPTIFTNGSVSILVTLVRQSFRPSSLFRRSSICWRRSVDIYFLPRINMYNRYKIASHIITLIILAALQYILSSSDLHWTVVPMSPNTPEPPIRPIFNKSREIIVYPFQSGTWCTRDPKRAFRCSA